MNMYYTSIRFKIFFAALCHAYEVLCGLQIPAFAGRGWEPAELCMQVPGGSELNLVKGGRGIRNSLCRQLNVDLMHVKVT